MDTNLIEYFGVALKEKDTLSKDKQNDLLKLATKNGYIIHPDLYNSSIWRWLKEKSVNHNSTFYKTWDDIVSKNRAQLFLDQIVSYAINYGMGGNFDMNDHDYSMVPEIRKYKVILPITEKELFDKCRDILYSGIALKAETVQVINNFIIKHYKTYSDRFNIDNVKNKESIAKLCEGLKITPNDKFNLLRYMLHHSTGSTLLIKNIQTIKCITASHNRFDMKQLSLRQLAGLASIFFRFKPLFLAFKKQSKGNAFIVNKIRRMANKFHQPLNTGFWESVVNTPCSLGALQKHLEEDKPTNFKLITLIQAIRENRLLLGAQSRYKMFIIRNGGVWTKASDNPDILDPKYDWWDVLEEILYKTLVNRLKERACSVKFPTELNLTCPTSEKNFIGNIPFGSYYNMVEHNMFGIYWREEWGTRDFDLSFIDYKGSKIGWNASYYDGDYNPNLNLGRKVIYSGDMTRADPEASEVLYFNGECKDGIIKVNRFSGRTNSKYIFSVAQTEVTNLSHNYMMDPNTIKFQTEVTSGERAEQMIGIINDKKMYICEFNTGNLRVSRSMPMEDICEIFTRKCKSFVDLKQLLLDAGFKERKRSTAENPIDLDLTDLKKDTLISLFS